MSPRRSPSSVRTARRGQQGMTLIETLLTVVLTSLLAVPMMGWAVLAMRQQTETVDRNVAGTSLGLLRASFVRDVTTAHVAFTDGPALESCGAKRLGGPALLVLVRDRSRVAYAVGPSSGEGLAMWRLRCNADGDVVDATELVEDVLAGPTAATCGVPDPQADSCRQVELRVTTTSFRQAVMTASVRAGTIIATAVEPPSVVLSAEPRSGPRPLKVAFSSEGSSDPAGGRLRFEWNFGDGTTSTEPNPTHPFARAGTHVVTLVATNDRGVSASATVEVEVLTNAPIAVIAEPAPDMLTARGVPLTFSAEGSNDDLDRDWGGRIVAYEWDFGDGTSSKEERPTKVYTSLSPPEGFLVRLTVTDDDGVRGTAQQRLFVGNRAPTVRIVATPSRGPAPLTVRYTAVVEDEPGLDPAPPLAYSWNLGDGLTSSAAEPPEVTYRGEGVRTVTLTVVDDAGTTASATVDVTVDPYPFGPPRNLRRSGSGAQGATRYLDLRWDALAGASEYEVFLRCENCPETARGTSSTTTIRINGLAGARTYYLATVRARHGPTGEWGPWSAEVRVRS